MTQTLEPQAREGEPGLPQQRVDRWFSDFEEALRARDVRRAADMFATDYWRDLVSFSWNLFGVEKPDGVADLLEATLDGTDPSGFATSEPADEADGVTTAWFTFETAVGRGRGLLRLVEEDGEDRAFTFLTTLHELKDRGAARGGASDGRRARRAQRDVDARLERREREDGGERHDRPAVRPGRRGWPRWHRPRCPAAASGIPAWSSTSARTG